MSVAFVAPVLGIGLALFPWAYALELVPAVPAFWIAWGVGLIVHGIALALSPRRSDVAIVASLGAILGLWAVHGVIVYERIVRAQLNVDYALTSIWISAASRDLLAAPANAPGVGGSYFAYYLDPLVPLLVRALNLTDSPFRLLAFQAVAVLSPSLVACVLAARDRRLYPFQLLLPAAYLLHPAMFAYIQADYHTAGIGSLFFFLGSYLFFRGHLAKSFPLLVLGALTKLSFWTTWAGFAFICVLRRRRMATFAFVAAPLAALVAFWVLQPAGQTVPYQGFALFGHLLSGSGDGAGQPGGLGVAVAAFGARLAFFALMLACFGLAPLLAPAALLPLGPLALVSLIERTGLRSRLDHQYAAEYLAFLLAAALLGLERTTGRGRILAMVALGVGALASVALFVPHGQPTAAYQATLRQGLTASLASRPAYERAVAFSECALAERPVLVTASQIELSAWSSFARQPLDVLWIDQVALGLDYVDAGFQRIDAGRWATFETLVFSSDADALGSIAQFPMTNGLGHTADYARLLERLPTVVQIDQGWTYRGSGRLADCASAHGHPATTAVPATPVRADRIPDLALFPCDAEAARLSWWFNRSDLLNSPPESKAVVEELLQDLEVRSTTRDGAEVVCFTKVQAAHAALDLDWRAANPPPAAPCEVDQLLAQRYLETVSDAELRTRMLQMFNAATVAEARKSQQDCLLATAAIRREYLAFLSSDVPREPLPDFVAWTLALPYRVPPEAVPLVDRFPCVAEADRLAWWNARPELSVSSPEAIRALDRAVTDATVKDPVECMGEILAATDALKLDWRNDNPPPSASCEADLALAHVYYDAAFDETLRAATLPLLNGATVANARRDPITCLLATSAVRRAYYAATGAPPIPDQGIRVPQAAQAPFLIREDVVPLLDRFPCRAEAARLAWWNDRPELLPLGANSAPVADALRESTVDDPIICFVRLQVATETLKLEWSPSNPPPVTSCVADLSLAATYYDSVLYGPLLQQARPLVERTVAANAAGDNAGCLQHAASVRRVYLDALGYRAGAP